MDDVEVGIGLDEAARRCADRRAHVREKEAAVRLGDDVVGNGGQRGDVALQELGLVRVTDIEVEARVLGLQKREQASAPKVLAVRRGT